MLPEILKHNMQALILDEGDEKFVKECMEGVTVGGAITLPSGAKIDEPPEGYVWYISGGEIRTQKK